MICLLAEFLSWRGGVIVRFSGEKSSSDGMICAFKKCLGVLKEYLVRWVKREKSGVVITKQARYIEMEMRGH